VKRARKPAPAIVEKVMRSLAQAITGLELPAVEKISEEQAEEPFQILIATILSARTQDATTHAASTRLFRRARTPRTMVKLSVKEIEKLIYPVSFYRNKARHVKACCQMLLDRFGGRVPSTLEELVMLPGVGRKTANLVMILGFKSLRNICVDTHVHRISNRWGYVATKTPEKTEMALRAKLPKQYWIEYNDLLVSFGQHLCRPISPVCSDCSVKKYCRQINVTTRR
jgi:endonuclease III